MIENAQPPVLPLTADAKKALELRAFWMRERGLPEADIAELCDPVAYPPNLDEELENVAALEALAAAEIPQQELKRIAEQYPPPADW